MASSARIQAVPLSAETLKFHQEILCSAPCSLSNRIVDYWGSTWVIVGVNYCGDYDVVRFENRLDGRFRVYSSCQLDLPRTHSHFAELLKGRE